MPRNNDGSVILPISFTQEDEQNKSFTGEKLDLPLKDLAEIATNSLDVFSRNSMQADLKMGGNRITGVKDGINPTDVATVAQAGGGGIFAEDISKDSTKIDLVQKPLQSIKQYKDGMQITFIVKNNSVDNMQVQLNGLGFKKLIYAGYGSFCKEENSAGLSIKSIMYDISKDSFIPITPNNIPTQVLSKPDFNKIVNNTRVWCIEVSKGNNYPYNSDGFLEVVRFSGDPHILQKYYAQVNHSFYYRMGFHSNFNNPWTRIATEHDIKKLYNLANEGTGGGFFKFTPKQGVRNKSIIIDPNDDYLITNNNTKDFSNEGSGNYITSWFYISTIINEDITNYKGYPPISTNLWFYLIQAQFYYSTCYPKTIYIKVGSWINDTIKWFCLPGNDYDGVGYFEYDKWREIPLDNVWKSWKV